MAIWTRPPLTGSVPSGVRWNTNSTSRPATIPVVKMPRYSAVNCTIGRGRASISGTRVGRLGSKFTAMASTRTVVHMSYRTTPSSPNSASAFSMSSRNRARVFSDPNW